LALVEDFESSGNWLFRWRSYLPLALAAVIFQPSVISITFRLPFARSDLGVGADIYGLDYIIIRSATNVPDG
jgi:hypothetical protein